MMLLTTLNIFNVYTSAKYPPISLTGNNSSHPSTMVPSLRLDSERTRPRSLQLEDILCVSFYRISLGLFESLPEMSNIIPPTKKIACFSLDRSRKKEMEETTEQQDLLKGHPGPGGRCPSHVPSQYPTTGDSLLGRPKTNTAKS